MTDYKAKVFDLFNVAYAGFVTNCVLEGNAKAN